MDKRASKHRVRLFVLIVFARSGTINSPDISQKPYCSEKTCNEKTADEQFSD